MVLDQVNRDGGTVLYCDAFVGQKLHASLRVLRVLIHCPEVATVYNAQVPVH